MRTLLSPTSRRVAVLGGNNSGKTVFVTALLDHLLNHDREAFDLHQWDVVRASLEERPGGWGSQGIARFPFEVHRAELAGEGGGVGGDKAPDWPDKTLDMSLARLSLDLKKGWRRSWRDVEIMDLPGERAADFGMAGRSYEEWSRLVWDRFDGVAPGAGARFRAGAAGLLEQERAGAVAEVRQGLLDLYRAAVAEAYASRANADITPSTLRLTRTGKQVGGTPEEFAKAIAALPVGLGGAEFAPLPDDVLAHPRAAAAARAFSRAYRRYFHEVVEPAVDWLKHADMAIYLVDVLGILQGSSEVYNSELRLGESALEIFRNRSGRNWLAQLLERSLDLLLLTRVSRLAVVATKADLVVGSQRENLRQLARQLLERKALSLEIGHVETMACAAVRATKDGQRNGRECLFGDFGAGTGWYVPSDVPARWPESSDWKPGDFTFRYTRPPPFDRKRNHPPAQLGLDRIARRILGID